MVANRAKNMMKLVFLSVLCTSFQSHAGIYEDIKRFVTTDQNYIHAVVGAVYIYSFACLTHILRHRFNFETTPALITAFIGSFILSKLAKDYPGYTTVAGVTYGTLRFFDVIHPLF